MNLSSVDHTVGIFANILAPVVPVRHSSCFRIPASSVAAIVAHGNRLTTLMGCMAGSGRLLGLAADVVVTSDPWPGVTLKGFS